MKDREPREQTDEEEENSREIISIPNIPTFTRAFGRIAKQHKFTTTSKLKTK